MNRAATALFVYGAWLLVIGIAGFLSNPEKAKTALLSGGLFGSLSILWGVLLCKSKTWALEAALATTGFCALAFTWRAWASWAAFLDGQSSKLVPAVLITGLWVATISLLPVLWKSQTVLRKAS